jgi:hypothetical protein
MRMLLGQDFTMKLERRVPTKLPGSKMRTLRRPVWFPLPLQLTRKRFLAMKGKMILWRPRSAPMHPSVMRQRFRNGWQEKRTKEVLVVYRLSLRRRFLKRHGGK